MKKSILIVSILSLLHSSTFAFDHITSVKEFEEVTKKGNVIVDFYASWCEPCKEMSTNLQALHAHNKTVKIYKVDIMKSPDVVAKYGTPQVPALLYMHDGKILDGFIGLKSITQLKKDIKSYFFSKK